RRFRGNRHHPGEVRSAPRSYKIWRLPGSVGTSFTGSLFGTRAVLSSRAWFRKRAQPTLYLVAGCNRGDSHAGRPVCDRRSGREAAHALSQRSNSDLLGAGAIGPLESLTSVLYFPFSPLARA